MPGMEDLEGLRRKLRRQAGDRDKRASIPERAAERVYRRDLPSVVGKRDNPPQATAAAVVPLEQVVEGQELPAPLGPPYLLIETAADELVELGRRLADLIEAGTAYGLEQIVYACGTRVDPADLVFLDLETTGLSSTPLFLIGTARAETRGLVIRQFFARSYAEEVSVLSAFVQAMRSGKCLVSFNGKTFDLPYLRARAAATGVAWQGLAAHVDLLHPARRIYKGVLPDCRLQTLERHVCGRRRSGDIPGAEIGEAYHEFVRTGHAARIATILKHNAQDLVTLVDLFVRMA